MYSYNKKYNVSVIWTKWNNLQIKQSAHIYRFQTKSFYYYCYVTKMKYKLLAVSSWAFEQLSMIGWYVVHQDIWPMTTLSTFPPNLKIRATPAGKWDALLRWLLITVPIKDKWNTDKTGEVGESMVPKRG